MSDKKADKKADRPAEAAPAAAQAPAQAASRPALPPPAAPAKPAANRRRDIAPALYLLGFVVLAAAVIWLFENPPVATPAGPSPEVAALRQQVATLESRLVAVENRKPPAPPPAADLAPVNSAIAVLQGKVTALENRKPPAPDLSAVEARIAALEARPAVDPALASRVDALGGRMDQLTGRVDAGEAATQQRLGATETRLAPLEKDAGQISALAARAARIARIQAAQAALDGGIKLGDIPGAPPALARYATAAPPTEASLRLSFGPAAQAALAASRPNVDQKPFLDRAWAQAQQLVTLRQGDTVILGDPAAGVIAHARAELDAGDLAGAVAVLDSLTGPPAEAIAGWKAQAQGLLDARAALADMAARA
ncbi:MAG: hypothetical protein JSR21_18065 [Proteobacteria bacterium]|nr:hypothetical protein [Pseudomonadota bacterium]